MQHQQDDDSYADYMETASVPVAVEITASAPLPVEDRPTRAWTQGQVDLSTTRPQQVAGAHPSRVRLRLKANTTSPALVYVAYSPETATPSSGYPLEAGEALEMTTRHPVYAIASVDGAKIAFVAEHLDG
ncbi:hypothetical protein [Streptomyces sp. NPDC004726]